MALAVYTRMMGATAATARSHATVVCAHATGFCASVFRPFAAALDAHASRAGVRVSLLALDFSGHGSSRHRAAATDARAWGQWCPSDVLAAISTLDMATSQPCYGVGHSMGGAALLMAMLRHDTHGVERRLFKQCVLFEPIVFPVRGMSPSHSATDSPLAAGAARRKHSWSSVDAARAYAVSKPLFSAWHSDALDGYLDDALQSQRDGSEATGAGVAGMQFLLPPQRGRVHEGPVTLACAPAFEADIYRGWHDTYDHLGEIHTPVTIIAGETSTHMARFGPALQVFKDVASQLPHGSFQVLPAAGHFCVMEAPHACADATAAAFKWIPAAASH